MFQYVRILVYLIGFLLLDIWGFLSFCYNKHDKLIFISYLSGRMHHCFPVINVSKCSCWNSEFTSFKDFDVYCQIAVKND